MSSLFWIKRLEVELARELPIARAVVLTCYFTECTQAGERGTNSSELGVVGYVEGISLEDKLDSLPYGELALNAAVEIVRANVIEMVWSTTIGIAKVVTAITRGCDKGVGIDIGDTVHRGCSNSLTVAAVDTNLA